MNFCNLWDTKVYTQSERRENKYSAKRRKKRRCSDYSWTNRCIVKRKRNTKIPQGMKMNRLTWVCEAENKLLTLTREKFGGQSTWSLDLPVSLHLSLSLCLLISYSISFLCSSVRLFTSQPKCIQGWERKCEYFPTELFESAFAHSRWLATWQVM